MMCAYLRIMVAFLLCSFLLLSANAGTFGVKSKGTDNDDPTTNNEESNTLVDMGDEDLLEVMEQFALMSSEERKEAFKEVMEMLGDDHISTAALNAIMDAINELDETEDGLLELDHTLSTLMEEQLAKATEIALDRIAGSNWESIYDKRGAILDSLISSGKISAEELALYRSDDDAWVKELRSIWDGLEIQAKLRDNAAKKSISGDEL